MIQGTYHRLHFHLDQEEGVGKIEGVGEEEDEQEPYHALLVGDPGAVVEIVDGVKQGL